VISTTQSAIGDLVKAFARREKTPSAEKVHELLREENIIDFDFDAEKLTSIDALVEEMCLLQVDEESELDVEACTFSELQELTSKQLTTTKSLLRKAVRMQSLKVPKQRITAIHSLSAYQPASH
jgi:hypothetical protein